MANALDLANPGVLLLLAGAVIWFVGRRNRGAMNAGLTLIVIGVVVFSGVLGSLGFSTTNPQSITGASVTPAPAATGGLAPTATCPNTLSTNVACRVKDIASTTNVYLVNNCYYLDGGSLLNMTSSATSPGFGGTVAISCSKQYTPYALSTRGANNGGQGDRFTASGDTQYITFESANASTVQVRVKDVTTDVFLNTSASAGAYSDAPRAFLNSSGGSQSAVGTDGYLEQEIWFRTNATNTRYGGKNPQCGVVLDADVSAWQQPSYVTLNGVGLTESKGSLDSDDQLGVAGIVNGTAEYFYPFPTGVGITDQTQILRYRIKAASGTDPTTDLLWTFECQGWTIDGRDPLKIRKGYFANDAGRNESTTLNQVVRITVD